MTAPRRARPTIGDRVTRSKLPVNGSLHPRDNAPAWVVTLTSAIVAFATARWNLDPASATLVAVPARPAATRPTRRRSIMVFT